MPHFSESDSGVRHGPRCRRCGKPIRAGTEIHTPSGYFCDMACAEAQAGAEARAFAAGTTWSSRRAWRVTLGGLAVLAVLCLVFYAIMFFGHGMTRPLEMTRWLVEMVRKLIVVSF